MKYTTILFVFIFALSIPMKGQMMYGPDTKIRSAIAPGAVGAKNQAYFSWLEYHSMYGEIKTGHTLLGGEYRLGGFNGLNNKGLQGVGLGGFFQHRDVDFWKESRFSGTVSSIVKLNEVVHDNPIYAALGLTPEIFLMSQPRHLTREEYLDETFLNMHEDQVLFNIHWGISIYSSKWYVDFAHHNAMSTPFGGDQAHKVKGVPKYIGNGGCTFALGGNVIMRTSLLFEAKGWFTPYKNMYLTRPSVEFSFLEDQVWLKYTFIKANSLQKNEFANRFMIGGGNYINVNFAYTFGNSQIYRNSQGNFEIFAVFDVSRWQRGGESAVKCTKKKHHGPKKKFLFF